MPTNSSPLQQALEWQVTFWSGEIADNERREFQKWLAADELHAAAWSQVQQTENKLNSMSEPGVASVLRTARPSLSRRKNLRVLGFFIGAGLVAYTVRQTPQWQGAMADYHTATGERKDITLPDGTQITLNTATAIDVVFDNTQRLVRIRSGEIFVATAHDLPRADGQARPFIVQTAEGHVRPIGTRFNVRQEESRTAVSMQEGAVDISPRHASDTATRLQAGQKTSFSDQQVYGIETLQAGAAAWTRGILVAERMRLEDFITELARYRRGYLRCDANAADLIVSGVYSIDDTEATLKSLVDAIPIRVQYMSRFWVTVQAM